MTGWGATLISYSPRQGGLVKGVLDRGSAADVLNKLTDVVILGHEECDSILENYERQTQNKAKLRDSNLCGNSPRGDSCVGDSGSGLVAWNNEIQAYELIGVVSFGVGCNTSISGDILNDFIGILTDDDIDDRSEAARGLHKSQQGR